MPKVNLTDKYIRSIKPHQQIRQDYNDQKVSGLTLRVTPSGVKSWSIRYLQLDGNQVRLTLGKYPEVPLARAREEALRVRADISSGKDPKAQKESVKRQVVRDGLSKVSSVGRKYFEAATLGQHRPNARPKRASTLNLEQGYFNRIVAPELGEFPISTLDRHTIQGFVDEVLEEFSPSAARQCKVVLRQIFNYAIQQDLVAQNPATLVHVPKAKTRERVLSDEELSSSIRAFSAAGVDLSDSEEQGPHSTEKMGRALLLTALALQRAGEVARMQLREIDLTTKRWTIPSDKTKNHKIHVVPLSDDAVDIIRSAIETNRQSNSLDNPRGYIFPSNRAEGHLSRHAMSRAYGRLADALGLDDVRLHDLRRTGSTRLTGEAIGTPRFSVSKILNHSSDTGGSAAVTGVYDRNEYLAEKRKALDQWALYLTNLMSACEYPFSGIS